MKALATTTSVAVKSARAVNNGIHLLIRFHHTFGGFPDRERYQTDKYHYSGPCLSESEPWPLVTPHHRLMPKQ